MNFRESERKKVRAHVDLTPLIDVVFLLLIFFMLSATFVVQSSIQVQVPRAEGTREFEQKDVSITLAWRESGDPAIYFDNVPVENTAELSAVLSQRLEGQPDLMVLIRSDARVDVGRMVEVLGIVKSIGVEYCGIAAQPPDVEG